MKYRIMPLILLVSFLIMASCIFTPRTVDLPDGCYRFSIPDPFSPDPEPEIVDFYMQFWSDGSGEGGFWESPLTESIFFQWEIEDDTLSFSPSFDLFENAHYSYTKTDTDDFILYSNNDSAVAKIHLSEDTVSRVDFDTNYIVGTWSGNFVINYIYDTQGNLIATISENKHFTFTADSLYRQGYENCSWSKSSIPHVIEVGNYTQWAVRTAGQDTIICVGRNQILRKDT